MRLAPLALVGYASAALLGAALAGCASAPPPRGIPAGESALDEADRLAAAGRYAEAVAKLEAVPGTTDSSRVAGRALLRAAQLRERQLDDPAGAEADAWRSVEGYPDGAAADQALRLAIRVGSRRDPAALRARIEAVRVAVRGHEIEDNLAFAAAELDEELGDPARARAGYEALARAHPHSGLFDDSLTRAARIALAAGDVDGALADLERVLDTQRTALIVGSFDLDLLDDAALEIGRIQLEVRHDPARAIAAFERLRDTIKGSRLRDDAQWWIVRSHEQAGASRAACAALARLRREFPGSRHLRREAPEAARRLGCPLTGAAEPPR